MRKSLLMVLFFFCYTLYGQREIRALRIDQEVSLDGHLNEPFWAEAEVADSFRTNFPTVGELTSFRTEVRIVYGSDAIYFGVVLHDPHPDSVLAVLSQRDDFGNADWFGVLIDPYGAGQNGFGFYTTAAGVELDAILGQNSMDITWNAVWKSKAVLTKSGWSLEMSIPFTQLRFPEIPVQQWKINFKRQVRRRRQNSFWNEVKPQVFGEITQSGNVLGIEHIKSPLRLSLSPYTTGYVENYFNEQNGQQEWRFRPRFGMDLKYGLSESFTLDATLVPDFGQAVSDRLILNLSPFEVRYNENRPFFLEGMDLFGLGDVFYTRRIGDPTYKGEYVVDSLQSSGNEVLSAPSQAQLINAMKVSGRTKRGLGIGVFNAIEQRAEVKFRDSLGAERTALAHPFSNYNVLVFSQNLRNNGNLSLVNTQVFRPEVKALNNVTHTELSLFSKDRMYNLVGNSQFSSNQLTGVARNGHAAFLSFGKVQGDLTYNIDYYECSNSYDPNELGFLARNNYRGVFGRVRLVGYKPWRNMLRRTISANTSMEYLYAPSRFNYWSVTTSANATFRNFLTAGVDLDMWPLPEYDYFESRTEGVPVIFPRSIQFGGFYSSDYSKKYALDFSLYNRFYAERGMYTIEGEVSPRFRFSNKLFVVVTTGITKFARNYGFVRVIDTLYAEQITIGTRDRWIVNNSISADYTFTNRMGMVLKMNHYWQEVKYDGYTALQENGDRLFTNYTGLNALGESIHNTSFNAFTVDLSFRWVMYPGSELFFLWKYNIYAQKNSLDYNYFRTFEDLFDQPQLNSFSIKALFFLDAGRLKRKS
jgi:hypothetical protein